MADREEKPPPSPEAGGLSADEADRLSERFRPSWEVDERVTPDEPAPARKLSKQTLIGIAPVIPERAASSPPPPASNPPAAPATSSQPAPARTNSNRPLAKQTLIGIAPIDPGPRPVTPAPASPSQPPASASAPPPNVISVRPDDGTTGIAKPYRPKDDPAGPAIVLTDEVRKTEAQAIAEVEAKRTQETSMRRMQTVMNMKAPEFPTARPPRRKSGALRLALGAVALLLVLFILVKLSSRQDASAPEAATPPATTEQPSPAANEDLPQPPPRETAEPTPAPAAPPTTAETAQPAQAEKTRAVAPAAPKRTAPKPERPSAPRATSVAPAKKANDIVRDTPF